MRVCPRCQRECDDASAYCNGCGAALGSDWSRPPATPSDSASSTDSVPLAPRSNTALFVILGLLAVVLVVAVLVCGGLFLFLFTSKSPSRPAPASISASSVPAPALPPPPATAPGMPVPPPPIAIPPVSTVPAVPGLTPIPAPPPIPVPAIEPDPVADRKVRLTITAETWRDGKQPYDIKKELVKQFAHEGIAVIEDAKAEVDGTVTVSYEEREGKLYHAMGATAKDDEEATDAQIEAMTGTKIYFNLKLIRKPGEAACLELDQDADLGSMPMVEVGKTMHEASLDLFLRSDLSYAHAGEFVGTVLERAGSAKHLSSLMLDVNLGETALDALKSGGFKPETAADRARWALAAGDVEKAALEKEAAVPELTEYYYARNTWMDTDAQMQAALALAQIGGKEAEEFIEKELATEAGNRPENPDEGGEIRAELVTELTKAAATLKLVKTESDLKKLCGDIDPKVAAAAKQALKDMGLAVPKIKPKPKQKPKPAPDPDEPEEADRKN